MSASLAAVTLPGCSDEMTVSGNESAHNPTDIKFGAWVDNSAHVSSRADDKVIIPVAPDDFGSTVFYIYKQGIHKTVENEAGELKGEVGYYWIPSGTEGQLDAISGEDRLNWYSGDTEHFFWSWTWPLEELLDYSLVDINNPPPSKALIFINSDFPKKEIADEENGESDDEDSGDPDEGENGEPDEGNPEPEISEANTWRNGEALERLIGTKTDKNYIFNQDGRFVPLTYKHLVSRIILGEFILIDNTGAKQEQLQGRITFFGMPKRAMFYPLPEKDADNNEVAPYVVIDPTDPYGKSKGADEVTPESAVKNAAPFSYELNQYLSFYVTNEGGDDTNTGTNGNADPNVHRDMFYICPEVDFNELEFQVEFVQYVEETDSYIPHPRYGVKGGYYGNFKSIKFMRVDEDGVEYESKERILHAGEEMVLNMTVYEKSGPGAGVWIRNWDNERMKSATHHFHKGIYSDGEAASCRDNIFTSSGSAEQKNDGYDLFGDDYDIDGDGELEKVIHIYTDINLSSNHFRLYNSPDGTDYIINGMGYTLTFTNTSTTNSTPYEYFYISDARDLYVTNGIYTVYIDMEGYVCRFNEETGEYDRTDVSVAGKDSTLIYFKI